MNITIIADSIDDQTAGIFTYAKNLISALREQDKQNIYTFIHLKKNPFFKHTKEVIIHDIRWIPLYGLFRKYIILPIVLRKLRPDIVHDLSHMGPFLFSGSYKKVITVHDCTPLLFSHLHPMRSVWGHKLFWYNIVQHCDHIIAVSPDTKNDLIVLFPSVKYKITVIPLAPDQAQFSGSIQETNSVLALQPYILCVGTLEPRKNIPVLIKAFEILSLQYHIPHHLVLLGRWGWKKRRLKHVLQNSPVKRKIIITEYVSASLRTLYYQKADVFVYPSFYEGFGIPLLEAVQMGCPVIASHTAGIRTTMGDSCLYFQSNSVEDLVTSLYTILGSKTARQKAINMQQKILSLYTWEKTARATISLYTTI